MNFNIYNSLILAGIIQGLLFGIVVACSKKYRSAGTLYLVALIVTFSFNNLQYYLQDSGLISSRTLFSIIFIPYQLLGGPLLLFYGLCLLHPEGKLSKRAWWILTPFAIGLLLTSLYKVLYHLGYPAGTWFAPLPGLIELIAILIDIVIVVYLLRQIATLEKQSRIFAPTRIKPQLLWFKIILIVFFVLSFVWIYNAVMSFGYGVETAYYPLWIAMSVMIYWLGHEGIYKFGIENERRKIRDYAVGQRVKPKSDKGKNEHILALENLLVNEKRFLDPTITLDKIAEDLKISKTHLSRTINAELGVGFPDYLNALRVEEAKSYLANPEFANYTLVAIGLEAGFNSKTTFNAAFKKATSLTPSEYRNLNTANLENDVA